jgi:hypothetical protein
MTYAGHFIEFLKDQFEKWDLRYQSGQVHSAFSKVSGAESGRIDSTSRSTQEGASFEELRAKYLSVGQPLQRELAGLWSARRGAYRFSLGS